MKYEQDFIMRIIKTLVEALGRIIFNKKGPLYEIDEANPYAVGDDLYGRLCGLADAGKINEAENELYDRLPRGDMDYLEMGLGFYYHLNTYDEAFLQENRYSREEIKEGIETLLKEYGMESMMDII